MEPFTVTGAGYPAGRITAAGLPLGVRLTDAANTTATITGTPSIAAVGTHEVTVTATNRAGTTTQEFFLTVSS